LIEVITKAGKLYEVGGAVRDSLIPGQPETKDIDFLVTGIPYRRLCELLSDFGRVDTVGRSFGVIKFTQSEDAAGTGTTYDFVLPRKEYSTGSGHRDFEVDFDHRLQVEDDLVRRDFTMNAIAREINSGNYIDPLNGRADIEARLIRYTSPDSFAEDPLRMLRAAQFAARFRFTIEPETLAAITANAARIRTVSPERIAEELNKMLVRAEKPSIGFKIMEQTGLLAETLPELQETLGVDQPGPFHEFPVFEHSLVAVDAAPRRLRVRMAALLHAISKPQTRRITPQKATFYGHEVIGARRARSLLRRLRYSNRFADEVAVLIERHMFASEVTDKGLRRLLRRVGVELIFDLLDLRRADVVAQGKGGTTEDIDELENRIREMIEAKEPFGLKDLAVNGSDLMTELNLAEGRQIGALLEYLLDQVLDNPEINEREILLRYASAYMDNKA
jgi:putative nucleotidyltransferase with HDIG domain